MHALDAGASGVVIPQVRTVADVERAVAWCRYPPAGLRGIAPRRTSGYRAADRCVHGRGERRGAPAASRSRPAKRSRRSTRSSRSPGSTRSSSVRTTWRPRSATPAGSPTPRSRRRSPTSSSGPRPMGFPAGAWTQSTAVARRRREQGFRLGHDQRRLRLHRDAPPRPPCGSSARADVPARPPGGPVRPARRSRARSGCGC